MPENYADDPHVVHRLVIADPLANFLAIDIRQHDVEHKQIGVIFLHHHPGIEAVIDGADFRNGRPGASRTSEISSTNSWSSSTLQNLAALPAFRSVGRNAIVTHERVQLLARNAAKTAPGQRGNL